MHANEVLLNSLVLFLDLPELEHLVLRAGGLDGKLLEELLLMLEKLLLGVDGLVVYQDAALVGTGVGPLLVRPFVVEFGLERIFIHLTVALAGALLNHNVYLFIRLIKAVPLIFISVFLKGVVWNLLNYL